MGLLIDFFWFNFKMKNNILAVVCVLVLISCTKRQVINKIENVVEIGTYEVSGFVNNTTNERAFIQNCNYLTAEIRKGSSGTLNDSINGLYSRTLEFNTLKSILEAKSGDLSISSLAPSNYSTLIVDENSGYLKKADLASRNSHFDPRSNNLNTSNGGRFRQYNGYLFDKYGMDLVEINDKMLYSLLYQKVFGELLTIEKINLTNLDKALVYYGAPTSFTNGISNTSAKDQFVALCAASRDNAYGRGNGGYYSIIKTQFISLQKQLVSNSNNKESVGLKIDSIRLNWEKALMATAIYKLRLCTGGFNSSSASDSVFAKSLHDFSGAVGLIKSFKGLTVTKIITDAQLIEVLDLLYAHNITDASNPLMLTKDSDRISKAILKLKSIYKFSDIQVNSYFLEDDVINRNIGMRRGN